MFRKLFGGNKKRKQLSQSDLPIQTTDGTDGIIRTNAAAAAATTTNHPMYTYAMKEYAQTVPAETSNDDGHIRPSFSMQQQEQQQHDPSSENNNSYLHPIQEDAVLSSSPTSPSMQQQHQTAVPDGTDDSKVASPMSPNNANVNRSTSHLSQTSSMSKQRSGGISSIHNHVEDQESVLSSGRTRSMMTRTPSVLSPKIDYSASSSSFAAFAYPSDNHGYIIHSPSSTSTTRNRTTATTTNHQQQANNKIRFPPHPNSYVAMEPSVADSTYEETYGDAYVGGPIKYIYPSGYQSMRPRSGPWKLSIIICLCFTWLSIFVIGHCSDQYSNQNGGSMYVGGDQVYQYRYYYYNNNNNNNNNNNENGDEDEQQQQIDDDQFNIETKWCGSRLLYWMWVISMLITGLATAYCSVIGYIMVRDFAVANVRSQPPGVMSGGAKSDYYVQLSSAGPGPVGVGGGAGGGGQTGQDQIYQSDGNVRFFGDQIYRPTQAAVATTSR
jgi:hypothetical protein